MMGPRETAVRASLAERTCGVLYGGADASAQLLARVTFKALFNGAGQGAVIDDAMTCGKPEAEWGWPVAWLELEADGLISFTLIEDGLTEDGPDARLEWSVTELGSRVWADDGRYVRELAAAIDEDGAEAALAPP